MMFFLLLHAFLCKKGRKSSFCSVGVLHRASDDAMRPSSTHAAGSLSKPLLALTYPRGSVRLCAVIISSQPHRNGSQRSNVHAAVANRSSQQKWARKDSLSLSFVCCKQRRSLSIGSLTPSPSASSRERERERAHSPSVPLPSAMNAAAAPCTFPSASAPRTPAGWQPTKQSSERERRERGQASAVLPCCTGQGDASAAAEGLAQRRCGIRPPLLFAELSRAV